MAYTPKIDEKQLVSDLQKPDTSREAFDTLMRTYGEQIYWQIRKMVVRHEDASDLLQNTFLKAWNNLDSFRGTAKLSTWLHKIAVNESINFLNKERGRAMSRLMKTVVTVIWRNILWLINILTVTS